MKSPINTLFFDKKKSASECIVAWNCSYFVLNFKYAFSVSLTVYLPQEWKDKFYLFLWLFTKHLRD